MRKKEQDKSKGRRKTPRISLPNHKDGHFEESITFNLADAMEYGSNTIVVHTILIEDTCEIQALAFDFGKVLSYKKSPYSRFIHILEGKAEIVIDNNSTFLQSGDSIVISANTTSSIEANQRFKMICTTINNK